MLLDTSAFASLVGLPAGSILRLASGPGGFRPAVIGETIKGRGHRWTLGQALAVVVGRGLRKRGVRADSAGDVMAFMWKLSQEHLEHLFAEGVTNVLVVGDRALPKLLRADAIHEAAAAPTAQECARLGLAPYVLDVSVVFDQIKTAAAQLAEKPQPVASR